MPDGGMSGLVSALLQVATLLNIQVMTGCTVERIEWEASGVRGVSGEGFKPLRADIVVSTLGSISTSEQQVRAHQRCGRSAMQERLQRIVRASGGDSVQTTGGAELTAGQSSSVKKTFLR